MRLLGCRDDAVVIYDYYLSSCFHFILLLIVLCSRLCYVVLVVRCLCCVSEKIGLRMLSIKFCTFYAVYEGHKLKCPILDSFDTKKL